MRTLPVEGAQPIGPRLGLTRAACLAVAVLAVALYAYCLPIHYRQLRAVCLRPPCYASPTPEQVRALEAAGVSLGVAAGYTVALEAIAALAHSAVAAIIFWRRPADRMAWLTALMLVTFGTFGIQGVEQVQGIVAALHPLWRVPVYALAVIGSLAIVIFFMIFPDGRFAPRWLRVPAAGYAAWQILTAFFPGSWLDFQRWTLWPNLMFWGLLLSTCTFAQVYRYRHVSNALQRQQTKWAVFGFGLALSGSFGAYTLTALAPALGPRWAPLALAQGTSFLPFAPLVPLSIGVAILRSHLWDIDILIRRTLVYSALTGVLALTYFGSVLLLQGLLRGVTGGESPLVIVLSTLLIAALAAPLRRRVQGVIDKRFFRRKYDAARTLAAFAASARDETDLEQLSTQLIDVVEETMQPVSVGLWMWSPAAASSDAPAGRANSQ